MTTFQPFVSALPTGPGRLLAEVLDHALRHGRRSPADFIRHFPPAAIMSAFESAPQIRATFLTELLGVKENPLRVIAAPPGPAFGDTAISGVTNEYVNVT